MNGIEQINEKRDTERYVVGLPVEVTRMSPVEETSHVGTFPGQCLDISRNGAKFATKEEFHLGERVELTVYSHEGAAEFKCEAEIVRLIKGPHQYVSGVRITKRLPVSESEAVPE